MKVATYHDYLITRHWKERSKKIKEKREKCEWCGNTECLEVHHLTYERLYCELDRDLVLLCHDCHTLYHEEDLKDKRGQIQIGKRKVHVYEIAFNPFRLDEFPCHSFYLQNNILIFYILVL